MEMRVLGCLIEKQRTTPDAYPLTLNSLRVACNQSTNRDPVVDYSESDVRGALERLGQRRWTRLASWSSGRSMKYRHLVGETLGLADSELALLAVLMLRGPQTPGELRARTERLHRFGDGSWSRSSAPSRSAASCGCCPAGPDSGSSATSSSWAASEGAAAAPSPAPARDRPPPPERPGPGDLTERVEQLEAGLAAVRDELRSLREELGT